MEVCTVANISVRRREPMKPIDLSNMRVIDLSQNWDVNTPSFATYEGPTVKWIKRPAFEKVGGQFISSTLHVGTHLDAPLHFITNGQDIGSIPLDKLVGPGVVVDLEAMGIGDYDIYTSEHFEAWERKTGIRIEPGDIVVVHTGYHKHYQSNWYGKCEPNEIRYFNMHPGPTHEFVDWTLKRQISWFAIDASSMDHPMNTVLRIVRSDLAAKCAKKHGKPLEEIWPEDDLQLMHYQLFPHGVFHVENAGGMIDEVLDMRLWIGCFPFKFNMGEAAFCRLVAFVEK
jgi:arylformamidase